MRNLSVLAMLPITLVACSRNDDPDEMLRSPNGDYNIELYGKDLGACCTSRSHARIKSQGEAFDGLDEQLFEIKGGSDVQVNWTTPYHVEVHVCNAKAIYFKSDFSSYDFSKHIHVSVENALPRRSNGEVLCPDRSKATTPK